MQIYEFTVIQTLYSPEEHQDANHLLEEYIQLNLKVYK